MATSVITNPIIGGGETYIYARSTYIAESIHFANMISYMKANGYNAVLFTGFDYTRSGNNCYTDILLLEELENIVNNSSSESTYRLLNYSEGNIGDETGLVTISGGTGKIKNTRVTLIKL